MTLAPHSGEGRIYSRAEVTADAVVHAMGLVGALMAVPVMITLAAVWHGTLGVVSAATVYGLSIIAMFAFSACYNLIAHPGSKPLLQKCDHGAIFVKIAGTYTPFAVLLAGEGAWLILGAIWGAALIGLALIVTRPPGFRWLSLTLYLAMGWAVLVLGGPMLREISDLGLGLIVTGGLLYTVGVAFHLWDRLPFQNVIWHGHVLAATFVFYAAVLLEVGRTAP
ncbi:MAG: hemolysin III family protein [Pseudomonadota bacterium]